TEVLALLVRGLGRRCLGLDALDRLPRVGEAFGLRAMRALAPLAAALVAREGIAVAALGTVGALRTLGTLRALRALGALGPLRALAARLPGLARRPLGARRIAEVPGLLGAALERGAGGAFALHRRRPRPLGPLARSTVEALPPVAAITTIAAVT